MTPWRQNDPKQQGFEADSLGDHRRPEEQEQEQQQEQKQDTTGDNGGQRRATGATGDQEPTVKKQSNQYITAPLIFVVGGDKPGGPLWTEHL